MCWSAIKERLDREEEGFTLIELMVVVLIIAILLAIAIPTFLGARNSANARSMQSNLRNGLTAEQSNWTNTQGFNTNLATIEPALTWATAEPTTRGRQRCLRHGEHPRQPADRAAGLCEGR